MPAVVVWKTEGDVKLHIIHLSVMDVDVLTIQKYRTEYVIHLDPKNHGQESIASVTLKSILTDLSPLFSLLLRGHRSG